MGKHSKKLNDISLLNNNMEKAPAKEKVTLNVNNDVKVKVDRLVELKVKIDDLADEKNSIQDEIKDYPSSRKTTDDGKVLVIEGNTGYIKISPTQSGKWDESAMDPRDRQAYKDLKNKYYSMSSSTRIDIVPNKK